jgi:CPA2 family monovalent cation:H+ antiporter-2
MEHLDYLIRDLALVLVVAGATTLLFKKIRQPVLLGYILAGFLTGPHFNIIPTIIDTANIQVWAELGIIFIMFGLGLEFSFHRLANVGGSAIITAMTIIFPMILIGNLVGQSLGWSRMDSLFLGGMLSMSSTMVIIKVYEEFGLKPKSFSGIVMGTLIIEDIAGVFMIIVLSTISISKGIDRIDMVGDITILLMYLVLWFVLGIYLIPTILRKARRLMNDESLLILSLGLCLLMVVVANFIGFSSALGAFIAGSILAGTLFKERIEKMVAPIRNLFGAVFFVSVGLLIDLSTFAEYFWIILLLTVITIVGQMTFSTLGSIISGQSLKNSVGVGMSMVQIGEFSFIIASLGTALGVTSPFLYPIIVFVSVITIFLTPIFLKQIDPVRRYLSRVLPDKVVDYLNRYTSEKQSVNEMDEDWHEYLTKYFIRTSLSAVVLFCIYYIGVTWVEPHSRPYIPYYEEVFMTILICLPMVPIISIMASHRNILYTKLWLKKASNRFPLAALTAIGVLIGSEFIILTVTRILELPLWIVTIIAILIVILIIKSDFIRSRSLQLETRFFKNYNERIFAKRQKEHQRDKSEWVDRNLYVVQFDAVDTPKKNAFRYFSSQRKMGVHILKVIRDGRHINLPNKDEVILKGDRLFAMGSRKQIDAYLIMLKKDQYIENPKEDPVTLRDFIYGQIFHDIPPEDQLMLIAIEVERGSPLANQTIVTSRFRARHKGFIIGIERETLPMIIPDKDTTMEVGDIVWVLGTQAMADSLLESGMLE